MLAAECIAPLACPHLWSSDASWDAASALRGAKDQAWSGIHIIQCHDYAKQVRLHARGRVHRALGMPTPLVVGRAREWGKARQCTIAEEVA